MVPFDADEFWFGTAGGSLAATLRATDPDVTVLVADLHNVFPLSGLTPGAPLVDREFRLFLQPSPHQKVAFRPHPYAMLAMGNHDVARSGRRSTALTVLHLPWRSRNQVVRKATRGVAALDAGEFSPEVCHHWRTLAEGGEAGIDIAWQRILAGSEIVGLEWTPSDPMVITRPFNTAQHWYDEIRRSSAITPPVADGPPELGGA